MKIIRYFLEFIIVVIFFTIFKIIGPKLSSNLGGCIGKYFGPFLRKKEIIKKNIFFAFPNISEKEMNKLINKMWENIGRVFAEYAHLNKFSIYVLALINKSILFSK